MSESGTNGGGGPPAFVPNDKRRRLLDELVLSDNVPAFGGVGDDDPDAAMEEPMTFEDLLEVGYKKCFACDNITRKSLATNEKYLFMMKLYTENASNTRKDAIYRQILEFYDTIIRPELEQVTGRAEPWPLPCIQEHFDLHTNFPTDELVNQIRLKKAIRAKLLDNLAHRKPDGTIKFNNSNIRHIINLDKEIVTLLKSKKDISGMVGYNKELDY